MNVLIVYKFEDLKNIEILKSILHSFNGKILLQSTLVFCFNCEHRLIYNLCNELYKAYSCLRTLKKGDAIEIFYVNTIGSGISIVRLKKKFNKTLSKLDFEHLDQLPYTT